MSKIIPVPGKGPCICTTSALKPGSTVDIRGKRYTVGEQVWTGQRQGVRTWFYKAETAGHVPPPERGALTAFKVDGALLTQIRAAAKAADQSVSAWIRSACRDKLSR